MEDTMPSAEPYSVLFRLVPKVFSPLAEIHLPLTYFPRRGRGKEVFCRLAEILSHFLNDVNVVFAPSHIFREGANILPKLRIRGIIIVKTGCGAQVAMC